MPQDADFLSPRGLLVDDDFCLKLATFRTLAGVIQATESLPSDDDSLQQYAGFSNNGYQILYSKLGPIANEFMTVRQVAANLYYEYTGLVCDSALALCSTAPDDYDKIFADFEAMRQDPTNDDLRDRVQQEATDRLNAVQILCDQANSWGDNLNTYTQQGADCQTTVQQLALPFQGSTLQDQLTAEDFPEDLQGDLAALGRVKDLLDGFSLEDDMGESIQQVELLSAQLIANDVQIPVDYIQKHDDPDDNPLDGVVERIVLEDLATLQKDVTDFKNAYMNGDGVEKRK
ncbi:uncharacterized protein BO72DRAFT_476145 [Aspergillus fijiensis CBS 313.89]|uniref:Uncharacterized protein n=1 Tax=Aspergillus fijiensis CBS 313.89 TaxID=1448319 RepID=A0A8G1RVH6_9EURO|nr:uncharacterized protein BO72DRAFT_476145 [Aspergillus fijiensis CBS 313.89]RAK79043.1 hypothetical protein BO72DRAFT_476145 [Aspergillus fijiensis CBS 313.89]